MAKRKTNAGSKSRVSFFFWMIFTTFSGSGIGGYFNPNWPVIGPLVQRLTTWQSQNPEASLTDLDLGRQLSNEVRNTIAERFPGTQLSNLPAAANNTPYDPRVVPAQYASTNRRPFGASTSASRRPQDKLLIATFNIQVFGQSKMAKPEVVNVLTQVVRHFDLVAIQEVRAKDDNILPNFVASLNADGSQYGYLIGPRLGRSVSTEQYAYVFDQTRVQYDPNAVGTMTDPSDLLHREPFVARFRAVTQSPDHGFSFWLVNTHTDPDEVPQEVDALAEAFEVMLSARADEDDVILLGDLNASETQLGRLGQIPGIRWVVRGAMTNTRQSKAYDNILFQGQATGEFTGRWGVFDIERTFGLTRDQALEVSDHLPVWAEFSVWEANHSPR
ncbi:endonuclease/exonuclease/phosphatase family protein [Novipirellula artificiosorum]|uniref:Endonuclease/Exonuclease/phosphatase family protein n=1 Tax=Novipirellula artificiosorum TaxID=2528016 RepID=A0A5C6DPJ1_9BACT|nr:endonuclease/exonuclease/phosphatase family protein [Novipirellula artificiosorum]TWU39213.1 Endonuclease/Exonuclease/phosphatase family protein [Novipirellula artificiosorum]